MIVECEKCHTKFRLDDKLLKKTGSKVRCSICNNKFMVFLPSAREEGSEEQMIGPQEESRKEEVVPDLDKTLVADNIEEVGKKDSEKVSDLSKTMVGKDSEEEIEVISFEDIYQLDSGLMDEQKREVIEEDIDKAMDRAEKAEKKIFARDEEKKGEKVKGAKDKGRSQITIKEPKRSVLWIILLLVVLLGGAAAAFYVFKPDFLTKYFPSFQKPLSKEQVFDPGNKRLSIKRDPAELNGFFVDSQKAGRLFVVKGLIINNYPDKRSFIRVRSNILDSKGKVVKNKTAYAGNTISDEELLSLSTEEINNRLMNKFGKDNINKDISPKASIPFMIIFSELPADINEFTVEPISSSLAEK